DRTVTGVQTCALPISFLADAPPAGPGGIPRGHLLRSLPAAGAVGQAGRTLRPRPRGRRREEGGGGLGRQQLPEREARPRRAVPRSEERRVGKEGGAGW